MKPFNRLFSPIQVAAFFFISCIGLAPHSHAASTTHDSVCSTSCETCSGSYYQCDQTNCACGASPTLDSGFPRVVNQIPFSWSKSDPTPQSCSGANGTCNCGETTSDSFNQVPIVPQGACQVSGNTHNLPVTIHCYWNDYYCYNYCAAGHWVGYTYSCNCSTTCS